MNDDYLLPLSPPDIRAGTNRRRVLHLIKYTFRGMLWCFGYWRIKTHGLKKAGRPRLIIAAPHYSWFDASPLHTGPTARTFFERTPLIGYTPKSNPPSLSLSPTPISLSLALSLYLARALSLSRLPLLSLSLSPRHAMHVVYRAGAPGALLWFGTLAFGHCQEEFGEESGDRGGGRSSAGDTRRQGRRGIACCCGATATGPHKPSGERLAPRARLPRGVRSSLLCPIRICRTYDCGTLRCTSTAWLRCSTTGTGGTF